MGLESHYHKAMVGIYHSARDEFDYAATRFIQMIGEKGGLQTARRLLAANAPQEGFARLWECGCLDLTVEALVLTSDFAPLFTAEEHQETKKRLQDYGYSFDKGSKG